METLKKLFSKAPMSIGVVTHGISSRWVGEVSPFWSIKGVGPQLRLPPLAWLPIYS